MRLSKGALALLITLLVICADQILKIWVKTSFYYGEELVITDWFRLFFIENNGMAFGMEVLNKLVLTLFRVVMACMFVYYIFRIRNSAAPRGYFVCLSLITAGTIGNVIDCLFYGLVFDNPMYPGVASFMPDAGGYASFGFGRVVDMLYFPLAEWNWPDWLPFIGGNHFIFFHPVFNIADAALCVGVFILVIFYSRFLSPKELKQDCE